jgi:hypothetical protein
MMPIIFVAIFFYLVSRYLLPKFKRVKDARRKGTK